MNTPLELLFLETLKRVNNPDDYNCDENCCYFTLDAICNYQANLDIKIYRGVLSSLIKKGVIDEVLEQDAQNNQYYEYQY